MDTSQVLAFCLFPNEQWIGIDQHSFMAASRTPRSDRQSEILGQELSQARTLAALGHTVYLLPEFGPPQNQTPGRYCGRPHHGFQNRFRQRKKDKGKIQRSQSKGGKRIPANRPFLFPQNSSPQTFRLNQGQRQ